MDCQQFFLSKQLIGIVDLTIKQEVRCLSLFEMSLRSKGSDPPNMSLRGMKYRGNLVSVSLRVQHGNLLVKNAFLFMRLPRFARNDTFIFNVIYKRVA